ncbi:MAG: hypothetical protein ACTSPY_16610 [Candidatus Helarchaeota archaeon]
MKKLFYIILIILNILVGSLSVILFNLQIKSDLLKNNNLQIKYLDSTIVWSSVEVISENASLWNDMDSKFPDIAVDNKGNIHVVWQDDTDGAFGTDEEILYSKYIPGAGWSSPIIISDNSSKWNNGSSWFPKVIVDNSGAVHVVWEDLTIGKWSYNQFDSEIMYRRYTESGGWSRVMIISDDYTGWNSGLSEYPSIAVDNKSGIIHVIWQDDTNGVWGDDKEIMYTRSVDGLTWENAIVISDDPTLWNNGSSLYPDIAVDFTGSVHVVWEDNTDGIWGTDSEIMYTDYRAYYGWSNITVISDNYSNDNNGSSMCPQIAIDNELNVHVVWEDQTDTEFGTDSEIMWVNYSTIYGWSRPQVISDNYSKKNNGTSALPCIAINGDIIHIVWQDYSRGWWGSDSEIMYIQKDRNGWSDYIVISDDLTLWNNGSSSRPSIAVDTLGLVYIVWDDKSNGWWGNDSEIMFIKTYEQYISTTNTIPGFEFISTLSIFFIMSIIGYIRYYKNEKNIENFNRH